MVVRRRSDGASLLNPAHGAARHALAEDIPMRSRLVSRPAAALMLALAALVAGCATNPVTHKRELEIGRAHV